MDFWNFDSFWLCASPFCKNICIFLPKMISNLLINLYFSLELCMNSRFCTKVKNSQNSLKLSNSLSPCAAPFCKVTKNFYWNFFRFTTYFNISRLELGQRKNFLPPDHASIQYVAWHRNWHRDQKYAIIKKSAIFTQFLWDSVKMTILWVGHFEMEKKMWIF